MNEVISYETFKKKTEALSQIWTPSAFAGSGRIMYFYGKRVVFTERDVILFSRCSWCGADDMKLDENNRCAHCGGWVTA